VLFRSDDTVLVIATGPKQAAAFLEQLEKLTR
jgi:hypothetical protein